MRGPVHVTHIFVRSRSSVGIAYEQRDGGAKGDALEQPRKNFDSVGLVALRDQATLAGSATIEIVLYVVGGEGQARGTAVDDDTHATTMRFSEGRDAKDRAEGAGHVGPAANHTRNLAGDEPVRRA
jgi:hypothetical protein